MASTFQTNPVSLEDLLKGCHSGAIQLPDFQRGWVWDEDRIKSLIASISQAFPVGALMTLKLGSEVANSFARRPVEGAPTDAVTGQAEQLLLDGQQRMTSLYHTCLRGKPVQTVTPRKRKLTRWFYIDMRAAMDPSVEREAAIIAVPEDRVIRENFARDVKIDLSTQEAEYEHLMFPVWRVFDWDGWQDGFGDYWIDRGDTEKRKVFREFKDQVLQNFKSYQVPVIALGKDTSREAVCLVFEKVNTGGKPLNAFELLTAMYASQGFRLRDDWHGADGADGTEQRLQRFGSADGGKGVLARLESTDFLQAITLLYSKAQRLKAVEAEEPEDKWPAVRANRAALLQLPLDAYQAYRGPVEEGFKQAVKFLREHFIYNERELPYQAQVNVLAAIFAELGKRAENIAVREKLARWYWCGVFGELYGSASESRMARDIMEVPAWIDGGPVPITVTDGVMRTDRLNTMRTRLSAAYKGLHALLMKEGAKDFRSGERFEQTVFFEGAVDVHHIFPRAWCEKQGLKPAEYDTVVNKTPLTARTNRILSGYAPSTYVARLEKETDAEPAIAPDVLDAHLASHLIDPALLRADDFKGFMAARRDALLGLISQATRHTLIQPEAPEEGEDAGEEDEAA